MKELSAKAPNAQQTGVQLAHCYFGTAVALDMA